MKARCAHCQNIFDVVSSGRQSCPICGTILELDLPNASAPNQPEPPSAKGISSGNDAPWNGANTAGSTPNYGGNSTIPHGNNVWGNDMGGGGPNPTFFMNSRSNLEPTPWERRGELGFFKGLFDTLIQSVTHPTAFFSKMPRYDGNGAFSFYWLIVSITGIIGFFLNVSSSANKIRDDQIESIKAIMETTESEALRSFLDALLNHTFTPGVALTIALVIIPTVAIYYFVSVGILHACAKLLGGQGNFGSSMRAVGYAVAPQVLNLIPVVGGFFSGIGHIILTVIGVSELHQVSRGKAMVIYLLPFLLMCCGVCGVGFSLGSLLGKS